MSFLTRITALLAALAAGSAAAAEPRPRLIVMVVVDTLRADHMSAYGYSRRTTPDLDRLFREGSTLYSQSYAPAAFTAASKTSMLTGQRPARHGYTSYQTGKGSIDFNLVTYLKARGYFTISANANPNTPWMDSFFDERWGEYWNNDGVYRYHPADKVVEEAKKALVKAEGKDVFLFLQFADPHLPYDPPEYESAFFKGDPIGKDFDPKFDGIRSTLVKDLTPPVLANMRNRYDASIRYVDKVLTPFLRTLQKKYPEHLIVFTSDHGEAFLEHGESGHSTAMYNTVIRVPLVIIDSARRLRSLQTNGALVSGLDLFPTLVERLEGQPPKEKLEGRSFAWTLRSVPARPHARVAVSESPYYSDDMAGFGGCWGLAYFYQPKWGEARGTVAKLTTFGPGCGNLKYSTIHRNQWFNVDADPAQVDQLRPRYVKTGVIEPRFAAVWSNPTMGNATPRPPLTPEQIRMLKSLGYLNP